MKPYSTFFALFSAALMAISVFAHAEVVLDDSATSSQGKVLQMTLPAAHYYCRKKSERLPTVREAAEFLASQGVLIRESQFKGNGLIGNDFVRAFSNRAAQQEETLNSEIRKNEAENFEPVFDTSPNAGIAPIGFYFNQNSYQENPDSEGLRFWTSSDDWSPLGGADNSGQPSGHFVFGGKKAIEVVGNGIFFGAIHGVGLG